jgi:Domain of unknown function (DUF6894)
MPRFYFHICNGNGFTEDEEGQELPSVEAARLAAIRSARDIMCADLQRGFLDLSSFIEVEDGERRLVLSLTFQQAVDLTRHHLPEQNEIPVR